MPTATETSISRSDYVQNWKEQMKETHHLALQHSDDRKGKDVSNYFIIRWQSVNLKPVRAWRNWKAQGLLGTTGTYYCFKCR